MDSLPLWVSYISALAPAGAVIAATVAAFFAWRGHRRQTLADQDERFWRRLTWAMQQVGSGNVRDTRMGVTVLTELQHDERVEARELAMLAKLSEQVLERINDGDFVQSGADGTRITRGLQRLLRYPAGIDERSR